MTVLPKFTQQSDSACAGLFAQQNQWDLSNYDTFDMKSLGEDSYRDLSGIGIPVAKNAKLWPAIL